MRLPEQKLYDWLQRKIGHVAMLERVENRVKKDTPDLYLSAMYMGRRLSGWVELKVLEKLPGRATTPVKIPHWTTGQRYWALRHRQHGGMTWLVVKVGESVYVFDAAEAAGSIGTWTAKEWELYGQPLNARNARANDVLDELAEFVV